MIVVLAGLLLQSISALGQPVQMNGFFDAGQWGFLDSRGKVVIPPAFDEVGSFHGDLAPVRKGKRWGLLHKSGKLVVDYRYDSQPRWRGEIPIAVQEPGSRKSGYIDQEGTSVIPAEFDRAWPFSEGRALVKKDGKLFFIDNAGTQAFESVFDRAGFFHEGMAWILVEGKLGYINRSGNIVIAPRFEHLLPSELHDFSDGLAAIAREEKHPTVNWKIRRWGYIDKTGKVVIPYTFDNARTFSEGLAAVHDGFHWGFIDKSGKVVIPLRYQYVHGFHHSLAAVAVKDGQWGYIDHGGVMKIAAQFSEAGDFSADGIAEVRFPMRPVFDAYPGRVGLGPPSDLRSAWWGYIDTSGQYIWNNKSTRVSH